jgi:hypothetical protein
MRKENKIADMLLEINSTASNKGDCFCLFAAVVGAVAVVPVATAEVGVFATVY